MPYDWPEDTDFALWELDVLDRICTTCGRMMHVCDHRYRRFHTLEGPVELTCRLDHCPDPDCPGHSKTKSPEAEITIALPKWAIGWDVFCWIGHRRCSRHWAIPQIQGELRDDYDIRLSEDSIARYIHHYQVMLAARQQDPESFAAAVSIGRRDHPLDRRPPTREGARDPLRRPRADPEADLVRRTLALRHRGRGPAPDRSGQAVGRILGQAGGPLVVRQAGRVRHGDRRRVPRGAASLLRPPLPPRPGQAGPRRRQSRQGPDAKQGPRPADDRTGRAGATEGRDRGRPDATIPQPPSRRPRPRRTGPLLWSIPPPTWSSTIARRCEGSLMTIKVGH